MDTINVVETPNQKLTTALLVSQSVIWKSGSILGFSLLTAYTAELLLVSSQIIEAHFAKFKGYN